MHEKTNEWMKEDDQKWRITDEGRYPLAFHTFHLFITSKPKLKKMKKHYIRKKSSRDWGSAKKEIWPLTKRAERGVPDKQHSNRGLAPLLFQDEEKIHLLLRSVKNKTFKIMENFTSKYNESELLWKKEEEKKRSEETQAPRGEVICTKFYSSHMRELWPYPGYLSPALLLLISMINFFKIWVKENVWSHK